MQPVNALQTERENRRDACVTILGTEIDISLRGKSMNPVLRALFLFIIVTICVAGGNSRLSRSTAQTNNTVQLAGLRDRVTVRRDERGIPYIEATNDDDLYF